MAGFFDGGVFSAPISSGRIARESFFYPNFKDISNNAFFGGVGYTFNILSSIGITSDASLRLALRSSITSDVVVSSDSNLKVFYSFSIESSIAVGSFATLTVPFGGSIYSSISLSSTSSTKVASKFNVLSDVVTESSSLSKVALYTSLSSSVGATSNARITYDIIQFDTKDKNVRYADYRPTTIIVPRLKKKDR